jgi:hypothetical protein
VEPSLFAFSVVTPQGCKAGVITLVQPTSSRTRMISNRFSTYFPTAEKRGGK